jgi:uncharacterized membrane protein YgdD (TMEM256/DUF423 family)
MRAKASVHSSRSERHASAANEGEAIRGEPRSATVNGPTIVAIGAILGALAVILGAFGAHGLRARVTPDQLEIYETAVRYHFYHALALVLTGIWADRVGSTVMPPGLSSAAAFFIVGIAVFSGSLYLLVASGARWLGAVTPIGGVALIVGWLFLLRAALAAR